MGRRLSTIDLARAVSPAGDRGRRERSEPDRLGGSADCRQVCRCRGRGGPAAPQGVRARTARLRLVDMTDFDISACGGTHVATTGGVGIIAVASSERFRGGSRIEFVCGVRALRTFRIPARFRRRERAARFRAARRVARGHRTASERSQGSQAAVSRPCRLVSARFRSCRACCPRGVPRRHKGGGRSARRVGSGRTEDHRLGNRERAGAHCHASSPPPLQPSVVVARSQRDGVRQCRGTQGAHRPVRRQRRRQEQIWRRVEDCRGAGRARCVRADARLTSLLGSFPTSAAGA